MFLNARSTNGREFVRSKTLAVIAVDEVLTRRPVQNSSNASKGNSSCASKGNSSCASKGNSSNASKGLLAVPNVDHQNNATRSWSGQRRERIIGTGKKKNNCNK